MNMIQLIFPLQGLILLNTTTSIYGLIPEKKFSLENCMLGINNNFCLANPILNQEHQFIPDNSYFNEIQPSLIVEEIAKEITVRILDKEGGGSGVIIARRGQTYTVLTNNHVVDRGNGYTYRILTADGKTHSGKWQPSNCFGDLDLALVEFDSNESYRVAVLGDSKSLSINDLVYSAGFPNYYFPENADYIESTYSWGLRAFVLTTGQVGMFSEKSLPRGYSLGYTNEVEDGMSGGPVLNHNGELVGINGRSKYALSGINAYVFTDGTRPSQELFEQMDSLSWAIPIAKFKEIKLK